MYNPNGLSVNVNPAAIMGDNTGLVPPVDVNKIIPPSQPPVPLDPMQKQNWNRFVQFVGDNKVTRSPDGQSREHNGGAGLLQKFNATYPDNKIDPQEVPNNAGLSPNIDVSKIVPPANVLSPKDFNIVYTQSPEYQKRLALTGRGTQPQSAEDLYNTKITHDPNADTEAFPKFPGLHGGINRININPAQLATLHASEDEAKSHELSHITRKLSNQEQFNIYNLSKDPFLADFKKENIFNPSNISNLTKSINNTGNDYHDSRPDENKADLDALRYLMYKKGVYDTTKGDLDLPTLNKALSDPEIKNSFTTKRLLKRFDPDSIIKLNNTIAMNKPLENANTQA